MPVSARLRVGIEAVSGGARATTVTTPRGAITTPCFMPVGTRGAVRSIAGDDLDRLGAQVVLGNTYHLMLRPGVAVIERLGGLHRFTGWDGHLLTDSGGYQVFSLAPGGRVRCDDDGVTFTSTYDGSVHRVTPETAVEVQERLGADIQMALDVCPPLPSPPPVVRTAVERTLAWAVRARDAHRREDQALFGIVQGGNDPVLRAEAAERTAALGFTGFGIGGFSVGEDRAERVAALAATTTALPFDRPRYLMGVGDPAGLVEAVASGVDLFDCVLPTRLARHATILTAAGRLNLRNVVHATDDSPLDPTCRCGVCARWSRAYLRHLFMVDEPTAPRLATLHNLAFILTLVEQIRASIIDGTFPDLRARTLAVWG